jgi:hypothetical protein
LGLSGAEWALALAAGLTILPVLEIAKRVVDPQ